MSLAPRCPGGKRIGLQIIADSAYPCTDTMLPTIKHILASAGAKRTFNLKHARTRGCMERALGRLKGRWRILTRNMDLDITNIAVQACIILHNICEMRSVAIDPETEREIALAVQQHRTERHEAQQQGAPRAASTNSGQQVRDLLVQYLKNNVIERARGAPSALRQAATAVRHRRGAARHVQLALAGATRRAPRAAAQHPSSELT